MNTAEKINIIALAFLASFATTLFLGNEAWASSSWSNTGTVAGYGNSYVYTPVNLGVSVTSGQTVYFSYMQRDAGVTASCSVWDGNINHAAVQVNPSGVTRQPGRVDFTFSAPFTGSIYAAWCLSSSGVGYTSATGGGGGGTGTGPLMWGYIGTAAQNVAPTVAAVNGFNLTGYPATVGGTFSGAVGAGLVSSMTIYDEGGDAVKTCDYSPSASSGDCYAAIAALSGSHSFSVTAVTDGMAGPFSAVGEVLGVDVVDVGYVGGPVVTGHVTPAATFGTSTSFSVDVTASSEKGVKSLWIGWTPNDDSITCDGTGPAYPNALTCTLSGASLPQGQYTARAVATDADGGTGYWQVSFAVGEQLDPSSLAGGVYDNLPDFSQYFSVPSACRFSWGSLDFGACLFGLIKLVFVPSGSGLADEFNFFFTGPKSVTSVIASRWPLSWIFEIYNALITSVDPAEYVPAESVAANPLDGGFVDLGWVVQNFRSMFGTWASDAYSVGIWLVAVVAIVLRAMQLLGFERGDDD